VPTADEAGFSAAMNGGSDEPGRRFRAYLDSIAGQLATPAVLEDCDPPDFDLLFVPGGHGPMQVGFADRARWLLEDRLTEAGGRFEDSGEPWAPHIVTDGNLYTGQNPASSLPLATALIEATAGVRG
jgi:putative intracellular protease/amidase